MAEQQLEEYIANNEETGTANETQITQSEDANSAGAVVASDGGLYRDESKPVIVGVQMFFSRTENLDMVHQNFFTQFDLVLEWQPTKEEVESYIEDPIGFKPAWYPIIQFKNGNIAVQAIKTIGGNQGFRVIGPKCESTDVYGNALNNLRYPYIIECMYDVQGTFSEFLELHNFPMDCQDLTVSMQLMDSMLKASFGPYLNAKAEVVQVSLKYNGLSEYDMVPPVVEFYTNQYSEAFSALNIRLKIRRKWDIYIWKIVIFVGCICLSSLSVFTLHPVDDLDERYALLFTLLLTNIAFLYVVGDMLPSLTYLTLLDWYVVCGFLYLIIEIVGVGIIGSNELDNATDNDFAFSMVGVYFAMNLAFFSWAYFARRYEVAKLTFNSNDYKVHNYRQYKSLQERNVCYGIEPQGLSFTKEARAAMEGDRWADLPDGYEL